MRWINRIAGVERWIYFNVIFAGQGAVLCRGLGLLRLRESAELRDLIGTTDHGRVDFLRFSAGDLTSRGKVAAFWPPPLQQHVQICTERSFACDLLRQRQNGSR